MYAYHTQTLKYIHLLATQLRIPPHLYVLFLVLPRLTNVVERKTIYWPKLIGRMNIWIIRDYCNFNL